MEAGEVTVTDIRKEPDFKTAFQSKGTAYRSDFNAACFLGPFGSACNEDHQTSHHTAAVASSSPISCVT